MPLTPSQREDFISAISHDLKTPPGQLSEWRKAFETMGFAALVGNIFMYCPYERFRATCQAVPENRGMVDQAASRLERDADFLRTAAIWLRGMAAFADHPERVPHALEWVTFSDWLSLTAGTRPEKWWSERQASEGLQPARDADNPSPSGAEPGR